MCVTTYFFIWWPWSIVKMFDWSVHCAMLLWFYPFYSLVCNMLCAARNVLLKFDLFCVTHIQCIQTWMFILCISRCVFISNSDSLFYTRCWFFFLLLLLLLKFFFSHFHWSLRFSSCFAHNSYCYSFRNMCSIYFHFFFFFIFYFFFFSWFFFRIGMLCSFTFFRYFLCSWMPLQRRELTHWYMCTHKIS